LVRFDSLTARSPVRPAQSKWQRSILGPFQPAGVDQVEILFVAQAKTL
jgi:hypothetical protein